MRKGDARASHHSRSEEAWFCVPQAVVDLLAVRPGNHAAGAGCPARRFTPRSRQGRYPKPTTTSMGLPDVYVVMPFRRARQHFSALIVIREIAASLKQRRGITSRIHGGTKSCMCALPLRTQRDHVSACCTGILRPRSSITARPASRSTENTAGLTCNKCHNATNVQQSQRASLQVKDPTRTYLGLSPSCASCHEDKHKGQLGTNCAAVS